jgi:hypothetical protein
LRIHHHEEKMPIDLNSGQPHDRFEWPVNADASLASLGYQPAVDAIMAMCNFLLMPEIVAVPPAPDDALDLDADLVIRTMGSIGVASPHGKIAHIGYRRLCFEDAWSGDLLSGGEGPVWVVEFLWPTLSWPYGGFRSASDLAGFVLARLLR